MAAARLAELAWSRANLGRAEDAREGRLSRGTYPAIVALHVATLGATTVFGGKPRWQWLALLLAVQPLRAWVLLTLGRRWNTRGAVAPGLRIATDGPYAFVRHPNYAVVAVELAALPLAFGLGKLAAAVTAANAMLLAVRIHDEEALLAEVPGYRSHFANLPRFVPRPGATRRGAAREAT
jgi:methyltransferase